MIFTLDPLALPFCLLIWSIDSCLWLILLRLALDKISHYPETRFHQPLVQITDPIPRLLDKCAGRFVRHRVPSWLKWILIISTLIGLRHALLMTVMSLSAA